MHWLLSVGQRLSLPGLSADLIVQAALGSGSQGQVYSVDYCGQELALKWYFPNSLQVDPGLATRIASAVAISPPSPYFLWPLALAGDPLNPQAGLGYLMPLRPPDYMAAHEHIAGRISLQLQTALLLAFKLAEAFHALHSLGLCYKDISLGNLFINPHIGSILICDNDNVTVDGDQNTVVLGTPGFIAPEVLRGESTPSAATDLFSLGVLIFRLLTRHDPFRGSRELEISCLDASNLRRLYGEDPVFIFDPDNPSNRPDPKQQLGVLLAWPIYPNALHNTWINTFCSGVRDPSRRALTGEWKRVLANCLDSRQLCRACGQENFSSDHAYSICWSCGNPLPSIPILKGANGSLLYMSLGNKVYLHHFQPRQVEALDAPIGQFIAHPAIPNHVGLQNSSELDWQLDLCDGTQLKLPPNSCVDVTRLRHVANFWGHAAVIQPS